MGSSTGLSLGRRPQREDVWVGDRCCVIQCGKSCEVTLGIALKLSKFSWSPRASVSLLGHPSWTALQCLGNP